MRMKFINLGAVNLPNALMCFRVLIFENACTSLIQFLFQVPSILARLRKHPPLGLPDYPQISQQKM